MDNTVLSEETIAAVKNRPKDVKPVFDYEAFCIEPAPTDWLKELCKEHNRKLDEFLMFCLLQLGYTGPHDLNRIRTFILYNGIELECKPARRESFDVLYIVRCKRKNYEKGLLFHSHIRSIINSPATFKIYSREEK